MSAPVDTLADRFRLAASVASILTFATAVVVALAWRLDGRFLTGVIPQWQAMTPPAAFAVLVLAVGLWLAREPTVPRRQLVIGSVTILAVLLGAFTLVEELSGRGLAVDRLIQNLGGPRATDADVTMSPLTAIGVICLGAALLLLDVRADSRHSPAQWLCLVPLMIALLVLIGYGFGVQTFYQVGQHKPMALPSAVCILVLALGIACARPQRHPVALLVAANLGGFMARRLIPAAVFFPIVVGWLRVLGQEAGWYGPELGTAMFAVANIVFFSLLIGAVARRVTTLDAERLEASQAVTRSERHLRSVLDNLFAFVGVLDIDGTLLGANRAPLEAAGIRLEDVRGKKLWDCHWWNHDPEVQAQVRAACERGARGELVRYDVGVRMADDTRMTIDFQVAPLRDDAGHITHLLPSATDITARTQAENSLRQAHALLEGITEGTGDLIAALDPQFRFLVFNEAFRREIRTLYGTDIEIGSCLLDAITQPADRTNAAALWGRALRGERFTVTHEFGAPERGRKWFDISLNAIRDAHGVTIGAAHIVRDVTGRRRTEQALREATASAERSRAELQAVVNSMAEGVAIVDRHGRLLDLNPPALAMHDLKNMDEMRRHIGELRSLFQLRDVEGSLLPLDQWPAARALRGETFADQIVRVTLLDSGREFISSYSGGPVRDASDDIIMAVVTMRDITRERETEDALAAAKAELERRAHKLEETVAERTARLTESVQELERFSYSLSHDLRAPLRAMKGFSQMLEVEYGDKLGEGGALYLTRISAAASRLDQLIRDVLTYSRIVRERIVLEKVDLDQLTRQLIDESPALQPPRAEITVESPLLPVLGHEAYLTQALSNLIYNAVKFVAPGRQPHVRIWTERIGDDVRLNVRDNGIGIPKEAQSRLFGMFERLNLGYEGTGIGLSIVRKAVERMSGHAGLESEEGQGSTFWIQLKAAAHR